MQNKRGLTTLEKVVSSLAVAAGVFAGSGLPGCNQSIPQKAFAPNGPTSNVGPFTLHYSVSMNANERALSQDAINQHWQMYNAVLGAPANARQRQLYLYEVPLLNHTPFGVNQMGWADVTSGDVHLAAGAGFTFPDAIHQFEHSFWHPYEIYDQNPSPQHWVRVKSFGDLVVSILKQQRRLPP